MQLQLDLFSEPTEPTVKPPLKAGKPHRDISVQPNGQVLYRGKIGWFSVKSLAIENGYVEPKGFEHY